MKLTENVLENVAIAKDLGTKEPTNWLSGNVFHPFANALAIESWNRLSGTVADAQGDSRNPWQRELYPVGDSKDPVNWAVQAASSTVGTVLKYAAVGAVLAEGMRGYGAARNVTGLLGAALRNSSVAQIGGAGLLALAEKPGQGETRLGNTAGVVFSFSAFELGGVLSRGMSLPAKFATRFGTGATAGMGQEAISEVAANQHLSGDKLMNAAYTNGIAGVALPVVQRLGARALDSSYQLFNHGAAVDRFAGANFASAPENSATLRRLIDEHPWARVQGNAEASSADVVKNKVFLARGESKPDKLAHELQAISSSQSIKFEPQFKAAAEVLSDPKREEQAFSRYRQIRIAQEMEQLKTQHEVGTQLGLTTSKFVDDRVRQYLGGKAARPGATYDQVWRAEFEQFKSSGGDFRPRTEYGGIEQAGSPERMRELATDVAVMLQRSGYIGVFAGGAVRDELMGLKPKDYDIATSATPAQVQHVFESAGMRVLPKGEAFGVMSVIIEGHEFEIATLRTEGEYKDNRRPDSVQFVTSLKEDAARRDLTMNAMFKDPVTGMIYDYFGGQKDIKDKIIRAVGDANDRFKEDKLRMWRVARFAARYNDFSIHPDTMQAIRQHAPSLVGPGLDYAIQMGKAKSYTPEDHLLNPYITNPEYRHTAYTVSGERVGEEVKGLFKGKDPARGFQVAMYSGLLRATLPEMIPMRYGRGRQDPAHHPEGTAWSHTMLTLAEMTKYQATENVPQDRLMMQRAAAFFHDVGKPKTQQITRDGDGGITKISNHGHDAVGGDMTEAMMKRLVFNSEEIKGTTERVKLHMTMHDANVMRVGRLRHLLERPDILDLIALQHADSMGTTAIDREIKSRKSFLLDELEKLKSNEVPAQRLGAPPVVTGGMLIQLGYKPGPAFKQILESARDAQYEGSITTPESGQQFVKENFDKLRSLSYTDQTAMLLKKQEVDGADKLNQ